MVKSQTEKTAQGCSIWVQDSTPVAGTQRYFEVGGGGGKGFPPAMDETVALLGRPHEVR